MYQVIARKYRPQTFEDLIGQEAMVRTLRNAFSSGRIAHAFMLTGVRGVGKTTTARIIARALNCVGPDGKAPRKARVLAKGVRHRFGLVADKAGDKFWLLERNNGFDRGGRSLTVYQAQ